MEQPLALADRTGPRPLATSDKSKRIVKSSPVSGCQSQQDVSIMTPLILGIHATKAT
jgi:hypothetical protein